ncbi:MAG: galactose-1-epimerase, partial [Bacteroidia bacterium]|nr:galactose-1-epimerase [Bacteroidia bacterium]
MKYFFILLCIGIAACNNSAQNDSHTTNSMNTEKQLPAQLPNSNDFTNTVDGKPVSLYVLKTKHLQVAVTNYGARVVSILTADKNGNLVDVVVGPGTLQGFIDSKEPYYGAAIGRYGNRIAKGKFSLEGKE